MKYSKLTKGRAMFVLINILAKVLFQKYVFLFATSLRNPRNKLLSLLKLCIYFLFSAFDMYSMSFFNHIKEL